MSDTFQERLSQVIMEELERSGEDQTQLAKRIGVSKGTITNWKDGRVKQVYPPNLMAAARECGVNIVWIITGEGPKEPTRYTAENINLSLLEETVTAVLAVLDEGRINLSHGKIGKVVVAAFEDAMEEAAPPRKAKVLRFVNLSQ